MGAVHKLYDDQPDYTLNRRMKIPLQSEIAKFIEEKMGWPVEFCTYYADRFWNHYQAQGWKLSNGNAMKDWKAAFSNNWQRVKDDDDRKLLDKYTKSRKMSPIEKLDLALNSYPTLCPDLETSVKMYDYIKSTGVFKFPQSVIKQLREAAGNNNDKGKALSLRWIFEQMKSQNQQFKDVL